MALKQYIYIYRLWVSPAKHFYYIICEHLVQNEKKSFAKSVSFDDGSYDAIGFLCLQPILIGEEVQLKPDCCTLAVIL